MTASDALGWLARVRLIPTRLLPPSMVAWVPWPNTILVHPDWLVDVIVAHELVRVGQWQRYGWRFPFVYLWHWVQAGFSYERNLLEYEARKLTVSRLSDARLLLMRDNWL